MGSARAASITDRARKLAQDHNRKVLARAVSGRRGRAVPAFLSDSSVGLRRDVAEIRAGFKKEKERLEKRRTELKREIERTAEVQAKRALERDLVKTENAYLALKKTIRARLKTLALDFVRETTEPLHEINTEMFRKGGLRGIATPEAMQRRLDKELADKRYGRDIRADARARFVEKTFGGKPFRREKGVAGILGTLGARAFLLPSRVLMLSDAYYKASYVAAGRSAAQRFLGYASHTMASTLVLGAVALAHPSLADTFDMAARQGTETDMFVQQKSPAAKPELVVYKAKTSAASVRRECSRTTPTVAAFLEATKTRNPGKQDVVNASMQAQKTGAAPIGVAAIAQIESSGGTNLGEVKPQKPRGPFQIAPTTLLEWLDRHAEQMPAFKKKDGDVRRVKQMLEDYRENYKGLEQGSRKFLVAGRSSKEMNKALDIAYGPRISGQLMAQVLIDRDPEAFSLDNHDLNAVKAALKEYYTEHLLGTTGAETLRQRLRFAPNKPVGGYFEYAIAGNGGVFTKGLNVTAREFKKQIDVFTDRQTKELFAKIETASKETRHDDWVVCETQDSKTGPQSFKLMKLASLP